MDLDEAGRRITEAHGFAQPGLYENAWDLLECLAPAVRTTLPVHAVRLIICTGMRKWMIGAELVKLFDPESPEEEREAAGRFLLVHAAFFRGAGNVPAARAQMESLFAVWPEGGLEALGHPGLV